MQLRNLSRALENSQLHTTKMVSFFSKGSSLSTEEIAERRAEFQRNDHGARYPTHFSEITFLKQGIKKFNSSKPETMRKNYQRYLGLSVRKIINSNAFADETKDRLETMSEPAIREIYLRLFSAREFKMIDQKILAKYIRLGDVEVIRAAYESGYFETPFLKADMNKEFVKAVASTPSKPKILVNLIYEGAVHDASLLSPQKYKDVTNDEVYRVIRQLNTKEGEDINPLKFLWCAYKMKNLNAPSLSDLFLTELKKISINGENAEAEISRLMHFEIGAKTMGKFVVKMLESAASLTHLLEKWAIALLILSRVSAATSLKTNPDFSQLFSLAEQYKEHSLLSTAFPEFLSETDNPFFFEMYQLAMKNYLKKSTIPLQVKPGPLEKHITSYDAIQIAYAHAKDNRKVETLIKSRNYKSEKSFDFYQSFEAKVAQDLAQGKYGEALNYLTINKILYSDDLKDLTGRKPSSESQLDKMLKIRQIMKDHLHEQQDFTFSQNTFFNTIQCEPEEDEHHQKDKKPKKIFKHFSRSQESLEEKHELEQQKIQEKHQAKRSFFKEKQKKAGFKNKHEFSTIKQSENYDSYLQAAKSIEEEAGISKFAALFEGLSDAQSVYEEFRRHKHLITERTLPQFIAIKERIPFFNDVMTLIKYEFLRGSSKNDIAEIFELELNLETSIGEVNKNYAEYLEQCSFFFPLPERVYSSLLEDQVSNYVRKDFKKTISHILYFQKQITESTVYKICTVCKEHKIGLTLIEVVNLIVKNRILMNEESLKKICGTLQAFNSLEKDMMVFIKKYSKYSRQSISAKLFVPFIQHLIKKKDETKLLTLYDSLKYEIRIKDYFYDSDQSTELNLIAEKKWKEDERRRYKKQLLNLVTIYLDHVDSTYTVPEDISNIFEEYLKLQTKLLPTDYILGFMAFSHRPNLFSSLLRQLHEDKNLNTIEVFEESLKAFSLFPRASRQLVGEFFQSTLYLHHFRLSNKLLMSVAEIFRVIDNPTEYSKYLEYVIRQNYELEKDMKRVHFAVLHESSDESAKSQINQLLDLLFNPRKQRDKKAFQILREEEEKKAKLMAEMFDVEDVAKKDAQPKQPRKEQKQQKQEKQDEEEDQDDLLASDKKKKKTTSTEEEDKNFVTVNSETYRLSQKLIRKFKRRENFGEDVAILQKSFHSEEQAEKGEEDEESKSERTLEKRPKTKSEKRTKKSK